MTKSESTIKNYLKEAKRLIKRFQRETKLNYTDDPSKIIEWLVSQKATWKTSTWRQYKAAICYILERTKQIDAYNELLLIQSEGCKPNKSTTHSSSKKAKYLSIQDETLLSKYFLERKGNKWAVPTYCFIRATVLTGLRPSEWGNAKLIKVCHNNKDIDVLVVNNAKDTNGRANGSVRHLILINFSKSAMNVINQHLLRIRNFIKHEDDTAAFTNYQEGCRQAMKGATKDLFPKRAKRPTLYTCRHQFSANLKNAGYSLTEIAALMGHATDETATVHYGRKSRKKGGIANSRVNLPEAYSPEVATVRQVYEAKSKNAPHIKSMNNKGPSL